MSTLKFNQLLFAISNKTEEYAYGSIAIAYSNKISMYTYMNVLRHTYDAYSETILRLCDCALRGDDVKLQELVDYYAKEWGFSK